MQQLPEIILIDDVLHSLYTTPLKPWLESLGESPVFDQRSPNCVRGYIGSWKVRQSQLWLTSLFAWREGVATGVPELFDGRREVMADWFVGPLVVEPASSEIVDGAVIGVRTFFIEAGSLVSSLGPDGGCESTQV